MIHFRLMRSTLLASLIGLVSCSKAPEPVAAPVPYEPVASIQDLMQTLVDPAADTLWESVESTVTVTATEEKQPQTDAEWLAVRHQAIALIEAGNLLMMPGRKVVEAGKSLEDAHVAGINKPDSIQKLMDTDHATFVAHAVALRSAGQAALTAIDAHDVPALVAAGGAIDTACEQCHLHYWYPNTFRPK